MQEVLRSVKPPFCLAVPVCSYMANSRNGLGRPRLTAAVAALLFPQQEAVVRTQQSAELRLLVTDNDDPGAPLGGRP